MGDYGKYWNRAELVAAEDGEPPVDVQLNLRALCLGILDPLRVVAGGPLEVTSGWRPESHNRAVGGASQSQHVPGKAADVRDPSGKRTGLDLFLLAAKLPPVTVTLPTGEQRMVRVGGLGLYAPEREGGKFIHVDTRPRVNGAIVTWYFDGASYVELPQSAQQRLIALGVRFC